MKKILLILVGVVVLIYFVVYSDNEEGFDLNIRIGFEKDPPKPPKPPKRPNIPKYFPLVSGGTYHRPSARSASSHMFY